MCLLAARQPSLYTRTRPSLMGQTARQRLQICRYHGRKNHGALRSSRRHIDDRERTAILRQRHHRRHLTTSAFSAFLAPPLVFTGLLLGLWTYKCMMMVLFQNKIIYMPSMPPFARSEKIETYAAGCKPVEWREKHIRSLDGTKLALCVGQIPLQNEVPADGNPAKHIVICYFQGNGGSLPPRLPHLSNVLKPLIAQTSDIPTFYTIVALSYRGYWTSSGRPSQSGIELDAQAVLQWVASTYSKPSVDLRIVLWGQSIGAGVVTTALASSATNASNDLKVAGMILETPFVSIADMLVALYPQKWLPYRYLRPFLWNHWDNKAALRRIAQHDRKPRILLLSAAKDEIVPPAQTQTLVDLCLGIGFDVSRTDVAGAPHTEASMKKDGRQAITKFVTDIRNS